MEGGDELLHQLRLHQPGPQAVQDQTFQRAPPYTLLVAAIALAPRAAATDIVTANAGISATTDAAVNKPGQKMPGPAVLPEPGLARLGYRRPVANTVETPLYHFPKVVIDDTERRHLMH